ncbi:MAG: NAD(P)/FAD-dependent oxidoreductase [Akkermansiaceae bacterium]|nr:NAD(P)/FAD-dependent oxidoreductase [Akkermansiaceae bacterium]
MLDQEPWDLLVVGGGAAGYFAAITCAESLPGARVLILEKTAHVLGKVKVSGGGRCNVTHACFDPKALTQYYPRGCKSLIGPFHRWGAADTVDWFQSRGVELKTEPDGRMFPVTDDSQTVIDCLTRSAGEAGVSVRTNTGVKSVQPGNDNSRHFSVTTEPGDRLLARSVLLATGGTRLAAGARLAQSLGHVLIPNVPSLFAFNVDDPRLEGLPGVSVSDATVSVPGMKPSQSGPLLITHHGLSGPGILKLSAWRARELHDRGYQFPININWLPHQAVEDTLRHTRQDWGKRRVCGRAPFDPFPKRLWDRLCRSAGIADDCIWSQLSKNSTRQLCRELTGGTYQVSGKSINKDEFVTCGGVPLKDVNLKTMESKITPGLYFAGEILDIDGVTGGFNFQNAWTSGYIAGSAVAEH